MPQVVVAAALYVAEVITIGQFVVTIAASAYAANQQSRARKKAREAYNASLRDRLVMTATTDKARSRVYGRVRNVDGVLFKATHGDKSENYTLIIAVAGHEVDAVEQIYFNDVAVALDASGWVLTEPWSGASRTVFANEYLAPGVASVTLPVTPLDVSAATVSQVENEVITTSISGNTVTPDPAYISYPREVVYRRSEAGDSKARVRIYNGGSGQDLSADLAADLPGLITPGAHRFAGIACLRVDLKYDQDAFATGVPSVSAVVRGARVHDPRTGLTAWSQNPALCARDWALYSAGGACSTSDLAEASFIAAANACDVTHSFTSVNQSGASTTTVRPMYTAGMVCDTSADPSQTLAALVQSMAGLHAWVGGKLRVRAGVYTAPVATITGDWLSGKAPIEIVKDAPRTELVNIITPSIADAAKGYVAAPVPRIVADAYVAVDGAEYPLEDDYLAVTDADHAAHISGVGLRYARLAQTVKLPCNLRALPLEVFDVVLLDLPELGLAAQPHEVLGWEFDFRQAQVTLTLKRTAASVFDPDATFRREDALPNTALPNPYSVPALGGITLSSGSAELLKQSDGTIVSRLKASWPAVQDQAVLNGGAVELRWGPVDELPSQWQTLAVPGAATQAYLGPVQDGKVYAVAGRCRNRLVAGVWGPVVAHAVQGKTAPPTDVTGLASAPVIGGVALSWDPCADVDYAETELRVGPTWSHASTVVAWAGAASSYAWATAPGTYHVMARHRDTSGNYSVATAELNLVVSASSATAGLVLDVAAAAFVLPASSAGVVSSYAGASTTLRVLAGGTDDTANWTLARTNGPGVSSTLSAGTLTLTALADATDVSYVDCTATRSGYATLTRRVPVSKAKAGATGANGTNGTNGLNGSNGADGDNGANGTRTADARVFAWALSVPAGPTGTGTYTWATGAVSAAPAGWSLTPGTATAGFTLYAATVRLSNTNTTATDTINWTSASVAPLSAPGAAGAAGPAGDSARIAYTVLSSGSTLGTGTRTSTGSTSVPATGAWGLGETWQSTAPSYGTNQTVWQANGIFNAASNTITWDSPYISALKVGSLSAISANLGTVTAGNINGITITGGLFQTAATGTRITLNEASTANFRIYGNIGAGEQIVAQIGPNTWGTAGSVAYFGSPSAGVNKDGVTGVSNSTTGVVGASTSGWGGSFSSSSSAAVRAVSSSGRSFDGSGGVAVTIGSSPDPYGAVSVTLPSGSPSYSYFSMTQAGSIPYGIGISSSPTSRFIIGIPTAGHSGVINSPLMWLNSAGAMSVSGNWGCNGVTPPGRAAVNAAASDAATTQALVNQLRLALINCGICQ